MKNISGFLIIFFLFSISAFSPTLSSATYYIDPSGSDSASGSDPANAWATFNHAFTVMVAGDELILADGTYYQTLGITLLGTSTQPIVIKAMNDGQAVIDGEGTRKPGYIGSSGTNHDSYIEIEGIIFKNAKSGTDETIFRVWNNHNTFRRCSFYFAVSGTNQQGLTFASSQYNLAEDCISSYVTRHCFISWDDDGLETHNTFRRCFATGHHPDKSDSLAISHFNIYGGSYDIVENCIGWYGSNVYGASIHSQSGANYKCNNNKVLGSIFLGAGQVSTAPANQGSGISIDHAGGEAPNNNEIENCVIGDSEIAGFLIGYSGQTLNTLINNCTITDNKFGIYCKATSTTFKNIISYNNTYGYSSSNHEGSFSYIDNYGNTYNNGIPSGESWPNSFSSDPLINNAGLEIPSNSPCYGTGESGSDVGANICYRYVDGLLTGTALWPWPMQDRILAELNIDITAELDTKFGAVCQSLLPIEFLSPLQAILENNRVLLKWTTAFEQNNDYFLIERSTNGSEWENIGRVEGMGNSQISNEYKAFDSFPSAGNFYYRLKQIDFDGTFSYSNIAGVYFENTDFIFYPNPTKGYLEINISTPISNCHISVSDLSGRKFIEQLVSDKNIKLEMNSLPNGVYLIGLETESGIVRKKLVLQN